MHEFITIKKKEKKRKRKEEIMMLRIGVKVIRKCMSSL
jgi:hypothetical protein